MAKRDWTVNEDRTVAHRKDHFGNVWSLHTVRSDKDGSTGVTAKFRPKNARDDDTARIIGLHLTMAAAMAQTDRLLYEQSDVVDDGNKDFLDEVAGLKMALSSANRTDGHVARLACEEIAARNRQIKTAIEDINFWSGVASAVVAPDHCI